MEAIMYNTEVSAVNRWCFENTIEIQKMKNELEAEKAEFEKEKNALKHERVVFETEKRMTEKLHASDVELFEQKVKILEVELTKLAAEKAQLEKQRLFFERVKKFEEEQYKKPEPETVRGELFFKGIDDIDGLKKRYRDLTKIYHPDNLYGDVDTIQEINSEYDRLLDLFECC